MRLIIHEARLSVCRLSPEDPVPAWATGRFVSVTRTAKELSIVADAGAVPPGVRSEGPFRALEVEGPLDFGLVGVLSRLLEPIAQVGVSVLAIATFDTDYILIRELDLERAVEALRVAGNDLSPRG
jgi:hypothetical protein